MRIYVRQLMGSVPSFQPGNNNLNLPSDIPFNPQIDEVGSKVHTADASAIFLRDCSSVLVRRYQFA